MSVRTALLIVLLCGAGVVVAFYSSRSFPPLPTLTIGMDTVAVTLPPDPGVLYDYLEVTDGCGPHYEGECVVARSGPSDTSPVVAKLRPGMVLKVTGTTSEDGVTWYKVAFDEWVRYPGRVGDEWYVATSSLRISRERGEESAVFGVVASSTKRILIDRSDQTLSAYDGDTLFMETAISTGLALTPTPRGTFTVFKKTPSRYMQGPLPGISNDYYDLPGVPWNLYFTYQGAVIHGAYWHDNFGKPWSHGCVNLSPEDAQTLYRWADLGTNVIVQD